MVNSSRVDDGNTCLEAQFIELNDPYASVKSHFLKGSLSIRLTSSGFAISVSGEVVHFLTYKEVGSLHVLQKRDLSDPRIMLYLISCFGETCFEKVAVLKFSKCLPSGRRMPQVLNLYFETAEDLHTLSSKIYPVRPQPVSPSSMEVREAKPELKPPDSRASVLEETDLSFSDTKAGTTPVPPVAGSSMSRALPANRVKEKPRLKPSDIEAILEESEWVIVRNRQYDTDSDWVLLENENYSSEEQFRQLIFGQALSKSHRTVLWAGLINSKQKNHTPPPATPPCGSHVKQILLDQNRTFPTCVSQKELRTMTDILMKFAAAYPDIGYCQGMNFCVLPMLIYVNFEESLIYEALQYLCIDAFPKYHDASLAGFYEDIPLIEKAVCIFLTTAFKVDDTPLEWVLLQPLLTFCVKDLMFSEAHKALGSIFDIIFLEGKIGMLGVILTIFSEYLARDSSCSLESVVEFQKILFNQARDTANFLGSIEHYLYKATALDHRNGTVLGYGLRSPEVKRYLGLGVP